MAEEIDESVERVCLYGPRMKWLYERLQPVFDGSRLVYTETDYEPIIDAIRCDANEETLILLKGSRGMKLETIVNAFK